MNFDAKLKKIKNISLLVLSIFLGMCTIKFVSMGCGKEQNDNATKLMDDYMQCEHNAMIYCLISLLSVYGVSVLFVCSLKNNTTGSDAVMPPSYTPHERERLLPPHRVFVPTDSAVDTPGSQPPPYSINNASA